MGRLIDADSLILEQQSLEDVGQGVMEFYSKEQIDQAPTIEAIPKADYEARLKADMVAMLTEIQLEIDEVPKYRMTNNGICIYRESSEYISDVNKVIQQKIDALDVDLEKYGIYVLRVE